MDEAPDEVDRGPQRPVETLRPECICTVLRMTTRAVTQLYDQAMRPSGLRVTQYSLLANIERRRQTNVTELTNALAMDQTTVTKGLSLLERKGLIEPLAHPDARVKQVGLTGAGRKRLVAARRFWARAQKGMLRQVGTESWRQMRARLWRLMEVARPSELKSPWLRSRNEQRGEAGR